MFTVDNKFDLREKKDDPELVGGYATAQGTHYYSERSPVVDASNFKRVKMPGF